MASRFCCAGDGRPEPSDLSNADLPNARPSPVVVQQPIASAPYAPLGTGPSFPSIHMTDLNDLRAIFENASTDENKSKPASPFSLQTLYASPRKAPPPPQRSVGQQLRRRLSRNGTHSIFTAFTTAKHKTQPSKGGVQSIQLPPQKQNMLDTLISDRVVEEGTYDRDATELKVSRNRSPIHDHNSARFYGGHAPRSNHHSMMRSFEWMGPLFDG